MNNALNGARVLVTRPQHQAENLCRLIENQRGKAIRFPTLEIVGIENSLICNSQSCPTETNPFDNLSNYDWLIFTSANAVNFAVKANSGKIAKFISTRIAAIGKSTAIELLSSGLNVDLIPTAGFDSESMLAMSEMQAVDGAKLLIVKGQGGREELANVLRKRGAEVDYWDVYKRVLPTADCSELIRLFGHHQLDVIVITSAESLRNLLDMVGEKYNKKLAATPLVVVSQRIQRFAAEIGFTQISVAECPSDEAIVDTAIAVYNGDKSG